MSGAVSSRPTVGHWCWSAIWLVLVGSVIGGMEKLIDGLIMPVRGVIALHYGNIKHNICLIHFH